MNTCDKTRQEVLEALREAADDDAARDSGGGVHTTHLADVLGRDKSTIQAHMAELNDAGEVERVTGIGDTGRPRVSYLPAEDDADDADEKRRII